MIAEKSESNDAGFENAERGVPRRGMRIRGEHFRLIASLITATERAGGYEDGIRLREIYAAMDKAFPA